MVGRHDAAGPRRILAVFAHPDDETSVAGGTIALSVQEGVEVTVVTATRGEWGTLGTGGMTIAREELPAVREAEHRAVMQLYGAHPPVFLGYEDATMGEADLASAVRQVAAEMQRVRPDVVITWGPTGMSRHPDHIAVHQATVEAFRAYTASASARLFYAALPLDVARRFEAEIEGPEASPTVRIDIGAHLQTKAQALRIYRSQEDAQAIAEVLEQAPEWTASEYFHQAYPAVDGAALTHTLWG